MSDTTLIPAERRSLRARAHRLHPVVSIGQHGLTPRVLHEIDLALTAHELIKVRVFNDDRSEREAMLSSVCRQLNCAPVQHLGKVLVLWRRMPEPEKETKRAPKAAKKASGMPRATAVAGTAKRRTPGGRAPVAPRDDTPPVPRRARGKSPQAAEERATARAPRSSRPAGGTPSSPKAPRGKGGAANADRARGGTAFGASARKPPNVAPPAAGRRTAGGPAGLPRAPQPRRRRAQSR
jgi:putative YhbY family RNA-binding protein